MQRPTEILLFGEYSGSGTKQERMSFEYDSAYSQLDFEFSALIKVSLCIKFVR